MSLLALCLLACSSCSAPLLPAPRLPKTTRTELSDASVLSALRRDWQQLRQLRMNEQERSALISRYNASLLMLLRRLRHDLHRIGELDTQALPFRLEHEGMHHARKLREVYDDIVPAADVYTAGLEEHYVLPGIGVPLVGVIPASKIRPDDKLANFRERGTVSTLTAVLEFPASSAQPVLKLIPRHRQERVRIGKLSYPLAGDFSAPLEIYWNLTGIRRGRFLGLLNPQKLQDTTGLTCIERYDPQKIPVVLVHGLASSAETFHNIVNRLLSDETVRHHYQFWYFNYPTGVSWSISAARLRHELALAREHFDRRHTNRNWDRMVLVGHSMGGLITHLNQSLPAAKSKKNIEPPLLPKLYNFTPTRAGRVVYLATPHRGAPIARNRLVLFLSSLVQLPQALVKEVVHIATLQQDNALTDPRRLTRWYTSLSQLSPQSREITMLAKRPPLAVPTHSILGDRGRHNSPRSSDGIVPYWSSHLSWGTENIVPTDHHVQEAPETASLLKDILHTHLHPTSR